MFQRIARVSLVAVGLAMLSGCIEGTQTITLNPNGSGKVEYDTLTPVELAFDFTGKKPKDQSPQEIMQDALQKRLAQNKGVTAWKDVSVKWAADGRMHFVGTAYFDKLDDLNAKSEPDQVRAPSFGAFQAKLEGGELLTITARKDPNAKPNTGPAPPDLVSGTADEWDEYVIKQRLAYQTARPFMVMILTDLKVKTVFRLPGEVKESKGFTKEGGRVVAHTMDGNAMLVSVKKFMLQDVASWKKVLKSNPDQVTTWGLTPDLLEPQVVVHQLGNAQFDYAKEVQQAREAYPKLRERLKLDPNVKLPGEN